MPHDSLDEELVAEEEEAVRRATAKRRKEFAAGRVCAHQALKFLGLPTRAVPSGAFGEPIWPEGVVGSITHCAGYRACAVALETDFSALGIDAEPDAPLPSGILGDIARPVEQEELAMLYARSAEICWDRLLFSVKESLYKAWFPLAQQWLGFHDVEVKLDPRRRSFKAYVTASAPVKRRASLEALQGRWIAMDGLVISACYSAS